MLTIALIVAALLAAVIAVLPIAVAAKYGRKILYHPPRLPPETIEALGRAPGWSVQRLKMDDGTGLVGLVRPPASETAPWIVFFGGNAFDLASSQFILENFL